MTRWNLPLEERFAQYVEPEPNTGCMLWTGSTTRGYGLIWSNGEQHYAHRIAWEMRRGPIPAGLCCLHRCDQSLCVSVDHLFLGTLQDNNVDMAKKGRGTKSKRGLPYGVSIATHGSAEKPFSAQIQANGKRRFLGTFPTAAEAGAAAEAYRQKLYNEEPRP